MTIVEIHEGAEEFIAQRARLGLDRRDELIGNRYIVNPPASHGHGNFQAQICAFLFQQFGDAGVEIGMLNGTINSKGEPGYFVIDVAALKPHVDRSLSLSPPEDFLAAIENCLAIEPKVDDGPEDGMVFQTRPPVLRS